MRHVLMGLMGGLVCVSTARADYVFTVPTTYTAGTPFAVAIQLEPFQDLAAYQIDFTIRTTSPMTGLLSVDPPMAASSGYVFPASNFFLATPTIGGTDYRLNISDFTLEPAGVDIVSGLNDRITTLTVRPELGLTGSLQLIVNANDSFVIDVIETSLPVFSSPAQFTISSTHPMPNPVPTPSSLVCIGIGSFLVLCRRTLCLR